MLREIVEDTISGVPVVVSYCRLCNSASGFERTIDAKVFWRIVSKQTPMVGCCSANGFTKP